MDVENDKDDDKDAEMTNMMTITMNGDDTMLAL
jgi:hypothetical protein